MNDDFTNQDIDLFIRSYEMNLNQNNPLLDSKIPIYVEFLKTKKYYRINQMDEDYFFKKRFNITNQDIDMINKLILKIKNGETLNHLVDYKVNGNIFYSSSNNGQSFNSFCDFNENEDCPENIAREMLDPLAEKVLRLLHMLIKQNRPNAERVTKYESVFYMMLNRYDAK